MSMQIPFGWLIERRGMKPVLGIVGAYVAVYAALSLLGHYQDNLSSLKQLGIIIKGMPDRHEWQPMCIIVTRFPGEGYVSRANIPGYLFTPLVLLDQHLCHNTQPMESDAAAVNKYTRINDYVALCAFVGSGLWLLVFPRQAIKGYAWFRHRGFRPPPAIRVKLAGALWIAVTSAALLAVFSQR
jgi:hypothetical protein